MFQPEGTISRGKKDDDILRGARGLWGSKWEPWKQEESILTKRPPSLSQSKAEETSIPGESGQRNLIQSNSDAYPGSHGKNPKFERHHSSTCSRSRRCRQSHPGAKECVGLRIMWRWSNRVSMLTALLMSLEQKEKEKGWLQERVARSRAVQLLKSCLQINQLRRQKTGEIQEANWNKVLDSKGSSYFKNQGQRIHRGCST